MASFSDKELFRAQIIGGIAVAITLLMAILGSTFLKNSVGAEEYDTCLKNSGWTLLMVAVLWTALASWKRDSRS